MFERAAEWGRRIGTSYVTFVVLGLVIGLTVAPVAWIATSSAGGTVAVVPIEGAIDGEMSANYAAMMKKAREDPSIDAVVLVVNSGGGGAASSEEMYLQTKRTAKEMPVVASVDVAAASGAYYIAAASDYIYAKPSSTVGSIGVLATLPADVEPNSIIATTGPNKLSGADQREFLYMLDSLQRAFVGAVFQQRGEELSVTRTELKQARIYSGGQAVRMGLADEIGGRQAAIGRAARMAGLESHQIEVLRPEDARAEFLSRGNYLASNAPNKTMVGPEYLVGHRRQSPAVFLMVPESYVAGAEPIAPTNRTKPVPGPNDSREVNDATS